MAGTLCYGSLSLGSRSAGQRTCRHLRLSNLALWICNALDTKYIRSRTCQQPTVAAKMVEQRPIHGHATLGSARGPKTQKTACTSAKNYVGRLTEACQKAQAVGSSQRLYRCCIAISHCGEDG